MTVLRFSARVERALRELGGLPWTFEADIECEGVCPLCAIGLTTLGDDLGPSAWWHYQQSGRLPFTIADCYRVADASDDPSHPLRPRLIALLQGKA